MYTKEELQNKYNKAVKLNLSGAELLIDPIAPDVCNGIGAGWMWDNLRDLVGALNPTLILAADIHDVRYAVGGNDADRKFADDEFLDNAIKCGDAEYGWWNLFRYRVREQARKFYLILRVFGKKAWNDTQKGGENK